ncbi:MAG: anthranilate phosphoribosyltransferase, partial [Candidatus Brocadiae bacterium]|nr:anthranilate phosphoribosyltransferase [Candidatus Brocadiia bacterium]
MTPEHALEKLSKGQSLLREEARGVFLRVLRGEVSPAQTGALLMGLRQKGETAEELAGVVTAMRECMVPVDLGGIEAVDTCGTGGDGLATVNVSTAAAFVTAGAGVPVAKHGNRSASGKVGSADVLEALGVPVEKPAAEVARDVREHGLGFMFAPAFHPALRGLAPIRRELGMRTVFNLCGPLANPARPAFQVIGVPELRLVDLVAGTLAGLGVKRATVVHGAGGADEATLEARNAVATVNGGQRRSVLIDFSQAWGMPRVRTSELAGGTAAENAARIVEVLEGRPGPVAEVVILNAAVAIQTARGCAPAEAV